MNIDKEREAFEKWAYEQKWNIFRYPKNADHAMEGEYCDVFVNGAWHGWQEAKEKPPHCVTLTCAQLREALNFGAPDSDDQEQLETEMTIVWSDVGHSGKGYYCYYSELPEEGAIFLDEVIEAQELTSKEQP